jgi:UDP-N-acetylmuramoylalanine--D-glutamate ligase
MPSTPATSRPPVPEGPYVVAGLGKAGWAAIEALAARSGATEIVATDHSLDSRVRASRRRLRAKGLRVELGSNPPLFDIDPPVRCLVKSPGIPFDSPLLASARAQRVETIDELELGWRLGDTPMVGVTGTNGKSTVCGLIHALVSASGRRAHLAGNADTGRALSSVAVEPADWVVCEVSSFQLEGCTALLPEIGVFTNLTQDHLNRHGTMARYGELKRRLFIRDGRAVPVAVIDVDGAFGRTLANDLERLGSRVVRVGFSADAAYRVEHASWDLRSARTAIGTPAGTIELDTRLPGNYNARNVAAALAVGDLLEVDRATAARTIGENEGPPGRFEHVDAGQDFHLIMDFAHSADGVAQFLAAVRAGMRSGARLHVVLGLAGRGDPVCRQAIGRVARTLADDLIVTSARLDGEPRLDTLADLRAGAEGAQGGSLTVVPERREAMAAVLARAEAESVVAILGKSQLRRIRPGAAHQRSAMRDSQVVRELLGGMPQRAGDEHGPAQAQYGGAAPRSVRNTRSSIRAL